jgi:hypothetical protein
MTAKKFYPPWFSFKIDIDTKRRKLLRNTLVIELIKSARISQAMGESFGTWYKAMMK